MEDTLKTNGDLLTVAGHIRCDTKMEKTNNKIMNN